MSIAVIDYGAGNLKSVTKAMHYLGFRADIVSDPAALRRCDAVILPGVGAFPKCMAELRRCGMDRAILREAASKPLLGICLGMQMLFEESEENGITAGFGFLRGSVTLMKTDLPFPQIGWNLLAFTRSHPLHEKLSAAA